MKHEHGAAVEIETGKRGIQERPVVRGLKALVGGNDRSLGFDRASVHLDSMARQPAVIGGDTTHETGQPRPQGPR